ncbi:MAG: ABC transporter ATP-binding protein/permease, partial [Thaumarchaeota archaeon]|nr:ABC transporter ATP-binding protein/permease [Nitrososphaerota archaeon]
MGYSGAFSTADPSERKTRKYSDGVLLRKLLKYIFAYRRSLGIVLLSLVVAAIVGVVGPALLGFSVNDILSHNYTGFVLMIAIYALVYSGNYFFDNRRTYHMQFAGQNVIRDIRKEAFEKLQELSPSYYAKRETGRIMSYLTNDVDALSDFVTFQVPQVLAGFVVIFSMISVMFYFNVRLTLVSLVVVPLLVGLTLAFQSRIQESFVETRKKIAIVTSRLQEGITGVRVTQSLVKEDEVSREFDEVNSENLQVNLRANKLTSLFNALVQVIESLGIAIVLWFGANEVLSGAISVGVLVIFILYMNSFFAPIIQLTTVYNSYQSAVTGLDRVLQVLGTDLSVKEPQIVRGLELQGGGSQIEFEAVSFGYDDQLVLKNVSFKIGRGEVVAIVGPTGAGKSSIINLLLRFYDPQKGSVRIDGLDIRELKFAELRKSIGLIPQDPFLFSTTILENIRYGKPEASSDEVLRVARMVGVDDFVSKFPEGYNTVVAEGATNLSMGQKQLVCFARAFLSDPSIVVMDEATSGVDPVTELQLQRVLGKMVEERTAIIIAHRLSTIRLADRIIVLQNGEVLEEGSFEDLVSKEEGLFARMYSLQRQGLEGK